MTELKTQLRSGKSVFGLFLAAGSVAVAELAGGGGADFVIIDGEHGQGDERSIFDQLARLEKYRVPALVRIPAFRPEYVKRMLDFGAAGIFAPTVEDAAAALEFAKSMRYPPRGNRGMTGIFRASDYNRAFDDYYATADDALLCAVQIESVRGVENVEAIAATPGIDLLFIGHSDLTCDYGCYKDFSDPRIRAAETRIIRAARDRGKAVGLVLRPGMKAADYADRGVNFFCVGTDLGIIQAALRRELAAGRSGR